MARRLPSSLFSSFSPFLFAAAATLLLMSVLSIQATPAAAALVTCGGLVFEDYDADGERVEDYNFAVDAVTGSSAYQNMLDPGVAGVTATVTSASGAVVSDVTDLTGVWSVTVDDADFPIRVDFSGMPSGWLSAPAGADSGTITQFIASSADCADPAGGVGQPGNAGIVAPGSFCENRPDFITSCFLFGNVANHDNMPAIVSVVDGSQDNNAESNWQTPPYTQIATLGEVGTVWGNGFDRTTGDSYVGSFVKRHARLKGNPTTIYRVQASGSVAPWFTVDPTATDPHTADADAVALSLANPLDGWIYDYGTFDDVGKSGLGDVEVSVDGNTLYTVDLGNRELVAVQIQADGSAGAVTRTPITAAALGVASCPNTDVRPFGLGIDEAGLLHIGVVCSAESTVADPFTPLTSDGPALGDPSQLEAWVFNFNVSAGSFSLVTSVPVPTTSRGSSVGNNQTTFSKIAEWRPWVDRMPYAPAALPGFGNTYPQPIVSDIEFDGDDLIVGIMDRWGHQTGATSFYEDWTNATQPNGGFASEQPVSSGDIVRAIWNGTGYDFPLSGVDYTYTGDSYGTAHTETNLGAMVQIPGRPYVVTAAFDPNPNANTWQSGGLEWFDNSTGDHVNGTRLYNGRPAGLNVGTFEKAAGIGDVEADCGRPAIQIGNRVWFDSDGDGIQGPDESGMAGIVVELLDAGGSVIDTTTTDVAGLWYFDDLTPGVDHAVRIAQSNYDTGGVFATGGAHDGQGAITSLDQGGDDSIDSDASNVGGLPSITLNVIATDHTFDIGLVPAGSLRLGNRVWLDQDGDGVHDGGEPGISGVEVELRSADGSVVLASTTTDGSGFYLFDALFAGDFVVAIADSQQGVGLPLEGLGSTSGNGVAPDPDDVEADSDDNGDPAVGFASISAAVTLSPGGEPSGETDETGWIDADSNLTVDFGFAPGVEIGNLVWFDLDNDGLVDGGEPAAPGVAVNLIAFDETVVDSTTTDSDGHYLFTGIAPGEYIVEIPASEFGSGGTLAQRYPSTGAAVSTDPNDDVDDNADGATTPGGAVRSGAISVVADSEPTDEVDDSPTSLADVNSNLSIDFGFYQLVLGDLVWFDDDDDGIRDPFELPVEGVTLRLLTETLDRILGLDGKPRTATTDSAGKYRFDGLPDGTYVVEIGAENFAADGPLAGRASSSGNDVAGIAPDPDTDVDSDDNGDFFIGGATRSKPVTVSAGNEPGVNQNATVDFGFTPAAGLGSFVWFDIDKDGVQDPGEAGVDDVDIVVYDATTDAVVAVTATDDSGEWSVNGLPPGDYYVIVSDPASRKFTISNAGGSDAVDSDVSQTGRTQTILLSAGEFNPSIGAGIIAAPSLALTGGAPLLLVVLSTASILMGAAMLAVRRGLRWLWLR